MKIDDLKSKYNAKSVTLPKILPIYNDQKYLTLMKAHFFYKIGIAFSLLLIVLILSTYYVQSEYFTNRGSFVLILELACFILSLFSTYWIGKGNINLPIHYLLIISFVSIWVTIFYESNLVVARLDSIAFTFAILSLTPLLAEKKRIFIGIYFLINIIILSIFTAYIFVNGQVPAGDAVDYFFDNLTTYIFMAIIAYNIHIIYNNSIERNDSVLLEAQHAKEEVKLMNESLEAKVLERTSELNEAMRLIEDSNIELYVLNEKLSNKAESLSILNEKLALSECHLLKINAEKDKFFSLVAHDLKNPFVALINNAELLLKFYDKMDDDKKKSMINGMKDASQATYSLLENLLEWSRAQRGLIPFNPEEFNLFILVHSSVESLKLLIENKNITLINNVPLGLYIEADRNQITTVIRNLVSNAVKFTQEGGAIQINAEDTENKILISITDSGVGMDQITLAKLFKIDVQVTTRGTSGEKGTGLGLLLCKDFIEMHGGKIWAESKVGVGSTFYFSLLKI